jgi:hypothetical protein
MNRDFRPIHRASDKIEPRMARAIQLASERLRSRIPLRKIEDALESKDTRRAYEIVSQFDFEDAYLPSSEILHETVIRGGKIADEELRNG